MRLAIVLSGVLVCSGQDWPHVGGDLAGSKYSPLKQIHRGNVAKLKPAWTYRTGDVSDGSTEAVASAFECTPIEVDGVLYLTTPFARVIALDPDSGREIWTFDPRLDRSRPYPQYANRGVAFWRRGREKRLFLGTLDGRLIAIDATSGRFVDEFGDAGEVDLRKGMADGHPATRLYGMTSPPLVFEDLVIAGSVASDGDPKGPSGDVRAFDARTGKVRWRFHVIPRPGEFGHDTWAGDSWKERGGANAWTLLSCDEKRGIVYLPLTSPSYDGYGGDRPGANLFGDSVVALDARTGRRIWHYQILHHDIWDWDLPAQPNAVTLRRNGRKHPGVVQVTKHGLVFVLDGVTGEPWFGVDEKPVPQSDVPGEKTWPTQPVPRRPGPVARQTMSPAELTNVTPESRKECEALLSQSRIGRPFEPWGLDFTLVFPGGNGGANWGGASHDPESNLLFVNTMDVGSIGRMVPRPPDSLLPFRYGGIPGGWFWDSRRWPCQAPPWGRLFAIDLITGGFRWQVPLGEIEELTKIGVAPTGTPNIGGSIVTAGGLVFIAATNDSRFRAFDRDTGRELWNVPLPASGHATPMTYRGRKTGRQFIVIAAGGGNRYSRTFSDTLVAFSLP